MSFLDDIKHAISGKDPEVTQRVASSAFQYASVVLNPHYQQLYKEAVLPWMQRLTQAIPAKWYDPRVNRRCGVDSVRGKCVARAAGMCSLCQRDCCLSHAFVNVDGSLVCAQCIVVARKFVDVVVNSQPSQQEYEQHAAASAAPTEQLAAAYKRLGLTEDVDNEVLKAVYTKLLRRHHPDRAAAPGKKQAESRFKEIRSAYDTIMAARKRAA
jgi:DnaJ-domain-containing protein 1